MQVGGAEVLEDDTVHFAGKARLALVDVTLKVFPHMHHVFQAFYPYLDEAEAAMDEIGQFITQHTVEGVRKA